MIPARPLRRLVVRILLLIAAAAGLHAADHTAPPAPADVHASPAPAGGKALPSETQKELQGLLALGTSLTDRADYPAAEIAFRQILDRPEFTQADKVQALLGLARMHRKQGAFVKAAAIYERFLKDHPEDGRNPEVLLDLGRTLRAMGAHKLALTRFYSVINSTLKLNTDSFAHYQLLARTAQFEIAETLFEAGDFAEAGKFFLRLRLLDLAPADRARAHFKAACAQRLNQDYETAAITLRAFLEQWPDDENVPEARYLLAATLRQLNRPDEALAATLELLQAEQARSGQDTRRWTYWQRRTGNQLANEFFQAGNTLNALAIYQGLAALAPDPAWRLPVLYQIALCYERLHQTDLARTTYESIRDALAAGPKPASPELAELARMAAWRLGQLAWRDQTERQLHTYFDTTTGRTPPPAPPAPTPTDDTNGSPAATPAAL
jgi:TolA-binding protein